MFSWCEWGISLTQEKRTCVEPFELKHTFNACHHWLWPGQASIHNVHVYCFWMVKISDVNIFFTIIFLDNFLVKSNCDISAETLATHQNK